MTFKDNILQKIRIEALARKVTASLKITDSGRHIDRPVMRDLLGMIPTEAQQVRDLEIYSLPVDSDDPALFLVLDNEMPIYQTDVADIALRRSPTLKEMLNIRNAIKILNDKDVRLFKTVDSLKWVVGHLISGLDLHHTDGDIQQISEEGQLAFKIQDAAGVEEALLIFAHLLDFRPPPRQFGLTHHTLWGRLEHRHDSLGYGPLVCYGPTDQLLVLIVDPIVQKGPANNQAIREIAGGRRTPDFTGPEVFSQLAQWVIEGRTP